MTMPDAPVVSLVKQNSYDLDAVRGSIRAVLDPLGGMGSFVKSGQRVVLKPNLVMAFDADRAVTTHPSVVRAVAELALECGATVYLGDSPGIHSAAKVAETGGITAALDGLPVGIIEFTPDEQSAEERTFRTQSLAKELLEADVVINLPKVKTHCQMMMTLAVKNMFGAVVGMQKFQWHYRASTSKLTFAKMLYEVCAAIRPALTILDGIIGMDGNGPTSGNPRPLGFLAAGTDPCAIDATVLDILKIERDKLWTLEAAKAEGHTAWEQVQTVGADPAELSPSNWMLPESMGLSMAGPGFLKAIPFFDRWMRRQITAFPYAVQGTCKACGKCVSICPAQAMTLDNNKGVPVIDEDQCIRCYCCHELCPFDAMALRKGFLQRWAEWWSARKSR